MLTGLLISLSSCKKDDPEVPNQEELITTLTLTLTPTGGGTALTFSFQDLDGDGGDAPIITTDALAANTVYTGSITLLNEQESPAEDITEEVREEAAEHQLFYEVTAGTNLTVAYTDQDSDGKPLGVATSITTGDASNGQLTLTLRHEPNKDAAGVSSGNIANAGGETDIEVTFPVTIQ